MLKEKRQNGEKCPAHGTNRILPACQGGYVSRNLLKLCWWDRCLKNLWLQIEMIHYHGEVTGTKEKDDQPSAF